MCKVQIVVSHGELCVQTRKGQVLQNPVVDNYPY